MSVLLEAYRSRFGSGEVLQQGSAFNGPCPFCGGSSASGGKRSDRFIVWPERDENLGETCKDHGVPGVWFCRQCHKSGDTIAFLMESDGMTFKSACAELGIKTSAKRPPARRTPVPPRSVAPSFTPRAWPIMSEDPEKWREYATKLHAEARENLDKHPQALEWLARRGLDRSALDTYGIGYLPGEAGKSGRYRARAALGLPPKERENGSLQSHIFIPRGITIPLFDASGRLLRLRIRRPKPDITDAKRKYIVLEGSSMQPMLLAASGAAQLAAYTVVEAELDAMLIHHASGGIVGAFAALTNMGKPAADQHGPLTEAAAILVSLDYDPRVVRRPDGTEAMETPGGSGAAWWLEHYRNARRWPTPFGKDPGDAFAEGLNIRDWLAAGLPPSIGLMSPTDGRKEPFSTGMSFWGEGSGQKENRTECAHETTHASGENANLPGAANANGPPDAAALVAAWKTVPGFAVVKTDEGGVSFQCDEAWARSSEENWNAVRSLQAALMDHKGWWHWIIDENRNARVALENLLRIGC